MRYRGAYREISTHVPTARRSLYFRVRNEKSRSYRVSPATSLVIISLPPLFYSRGSTRTPVHVPSVYSVRASTSRAPRPDAWRVKKSRSRAKITPTRRYYVVIYARGCRSITHSGRAVRVYIRTLLSRESNAYGMRGIERRIKCARDRRPCKKEEKDPV